MVPAAGGPDPTLRARSEVHGAVRGRSRHPRRGRGGRLRAPAWAGGGGVMLSGGGRALARCRRAGRRAPAGPAEPGWAAREASPRQPPPHRAGAEAPRPLPRGTPGIAAPRRPRSSSSSRSRASLLAAVLPRTPHGGINKLIAPLTPHPPAAARKGAGGRGIRSSPS